MAHRKSKTEPVKSIPEQLDEVATLSKSELTAVFNDKSRPAIVRVFAEKIISKDVSEALKIQKNASRLTESGEEDIGSASVEELAVGDNDEAFYVALIKQNVAQLTRKTASPQEVARLSANINIFRKELRDIRSRSVKRDTVLARILAEADQGPKPKPKAKPKAKPKKKTTKKPVKKKVADEQSTKTRQPSTKA